MWGNAPSVFQFDWSAKMGQTLVTVPKLRFSEPRRNLPGRNGTATVEDRFTIAFMRAYLLQAPLIHSGALRTQMAFAREIPVNGYGIADLMVVVWQRPPGETFTDVASFARIAKPCTRAFVKALPADKRRHAQLVQKLAPRFKVDPRLALAIVRTESNFDAAARSPKNALGLMQLIPDTAERFGVRDALDPEQNVRGGLAYLRWLLSQFKGDVALAAAAYNAGEGNVLRYKGVPPFAETQEYVRRILTFYRAPRHAETLKG